MKKATLNICAGKYGSLGLSHKAMHWIIQISGLLYALLFLYTGSIKLMHITITIEQVAQFHVLKPMAPFIAWLVPIMEIGIGILVVIPKLRLIGFYGSLVLMTIFSCYLIALRFMKEDPMCGCGGWIENLSWKAHIVLNSSFLAIAVISISFHKRLKNYTASISM